MCVCVCVVVQTGVVPMLVCESQPTFFRQPTDFGIRLVILHIITTVTDNTDNSSFVSGTQTTLFCLLLLWQVCRAVVCSVPLCVLCVCVVCVMYV